MKPIELLPEHQLEANCTPGTSTWDDAFSFSLDNMPNPKDTLGYGDFEFLKDLPYFLFNGEMYMLDYEFALGKRECSRLARAAQPSKGQERAVAQLLEIGI